MDNLGITGYPTEDDTTGSDEEQISIIIDNFKDHPSIINIIENIKINEHFSFAKMNKGDVVTILKLMNINKPITYNIPPKMLVENSDICSTHISKIYNDSVFNHMFPNSLKNADITPAHKNDETTKKDNYRPISILFLKGKCTTKFTRTCTNIFHLSSVASGRVIVRNNV